MTLQQLKTLLEKILDEDWDPEKDDLLLALFNECLREDLALVLRLESTQTVPVASEINLPTDLMKLVYVELDKAEFDELSLNDYQNTGYKVFASLLKPQGVESGELTLYYHRYPAEVTSLDNIPDIPSQFKHALYYYVLARYQQNDEELEWEHDYNKLYEKVKTQIDDYTRQKQGSGVLRRIRTVY